MTRLELALFAGSAAHAPGEMVLVWVPQDERPLAGDAGLVDWRMRGEISRKLYFIIGQLMPHISVRATRPQIWRRLITPPPGP